MKRRIQTSRAVLYAACLATAVSAGCVGQADESAGASGSGGSDQENPDEDPNRPDLLLTGGTGSGGAAGACSGPDCATGGGGSSSVCGDGEVGGDETCDDGNSAPGDGCDGLCQTESGFECEVPGEPCVSNVLCGDEVRGPGEACDDGNTEAGDGCSADCGSVEPGFSCPVAGGPCLEATGPCGNATLDPGEECDDGQSPMTSGDGCSADCLVEAGYACPTPGQPCEPIEFCGDGVVSFTRGEQCDNDLLAVAATQPEGGDGCSATCRIETGWTCEGIAPSVCTYTVQCGDRRVGGTETCDDGDVMDGDGCSADCQVEAGYTCPIVGAACLPLCGDGRIVGREQCDDGVDPDTNEPASGDGCDMHCQLEPGWVCPEGEPCRPTVCGDGIIEGSEQCDDDNVRPYDGCSPVCMNEPVCGTAESPVGECVSVCGDGIVLSTEQCDDGNNDAGDGCSPTCTPEPGYACESVRDSPPDFIDIPVVYRDFQTFSSWEDAEETIPIGHPDMGRYCCEGSQGIVETLLGPDRKPVYAGTAAAPIAMTTGPEYFDQWYRDVDGVNLRIDDALRLTRQTSGAYSMNSATDAPWVDLEGFFPIDELGWGNEWLSHNYHFTSELRYWFEYQGNERLEFSGDDDVFVFINGRLAVDIGGVHPAEYATVLLDPANGHGMTCQGENCTPAGDVDFELRIGSIYEVVVFQAERWCCESNYWLTLTNFLAGQSSCEPDCGDGIVTAQEACDLGTDPVTQASLNTGEYGGCNPDCTLAPVCGDGVVDTEFGESCDDGVNTTVYDAEQRGCAPGCQPPHYCGDGAVDTDFGENCDNGADNAADAYGPDACDEQCQPAPYCGDGFQQSDEECDDGPNNGTPASRCGLDCQIQCGDGVIDSGEQCDDGPQNGTAASECDVNCQLKCGNGVRDGGEECDNGVNDGSYGTCNPDCTLPDYCGDGVVNGPEECDLAENNQAEPYGPDTCTIACRVGPFCGDGQVYEPEEDCDGESSCNSECRWEVPE